MYAATNGVNTHKGILFSMGLLTGAIGRLMRPDGSPPSIDAVLEEASRIYRPYAQDDLKGIGTSTAGGRAYLEAGLCGIRGEVAGGFPSVSEIAIPAYKRALESGKNENDAGVIALLSLIACVYDTNLYKRGGAAGLQYARERAAALLAQDPLTDSALRQADDDFISRNLSPGGSADLLAVTYFLTRLKGL